eukprot:CAMPEP_0171068360 /NCGR_PEP_ID=MMETSP0766_2-20121228/8518_1 /TAXON_ID=439317 /ORGANISM="Gambierdiscus australes, Strain CAWD 149" /LENGTH=390 /DNA_ID=CAMNT_0011524665 /DNA_START=10 /DNA_END=1182 /DNA_ORIENTATION=+
MSVPSSPPSRKPGYDEQQDLIAALVHTESGHTFTAAELQDQGKWLSNPPPPQNLWDRADAAYVDLVRCRAWVWVTSVDPKNGTFSCRMKCQWLVRLVNHKERTDPRIRVPGIRMPRMMVVVDESRLWRDTMQDSAATVCWQGMSVFEMSGYEKFEVMDFPFDRQIINLDLFHFVWRRNKDDDAFEESMKVVDFEMVTTCVLPEFTTYKAVITPQKVMEPEHGPQHCSRFEVVLRVERRQKYYVLQIFTVSYIITMVSTLAMSLKPEQGEIANKLGIICSGLLTLMSFKYSVADSLPKVPYVTFTDSYLQLQLVTLVSVAVESVLSYKLCDKYGFSLNLLDTMEDILLAVVFCCWTGLYVYAAILKARRRKSWQSILNRAEEEDDEPEDQQ